MIAPEPYHRACLAVLYAATVHARCLGWSGIGQLRRRLSKNHQQQLVDMMDAVHNIPVMLLSWENCDEQRLRDDLHRYDKKWAERYPLSLLAVYENGLEGGFSCMSP